MGRALERQLEAALAASAAATLLLVARNGLAPHQGPLSFGLVFWKWWALFYLAVASAVFLVAAGLARLGERRELPQRTVSLQALLFAVIVPAANLGAVAQLLSLPGKARFQWLCPAGFGLAILTLVALALLPPRRQMAVRALALAAAVATVAALAPVGRRLAANGGAWPKPRASGERLLVIGVDGADWRLIEPLFARGELPQLAALRARGAWGKLRSVRPTLSPIIWTTIATGRRQTEHGVSGHLVQHLEGVDAPLPELLPIRAAGYDALRGWLERTGRIAEGPITSTVRRVPAFWNLSTRRGSPVSVLNWWATWPAEPVLGHVVSERAYYRAVEAPGTVDSERTTFPERLFAEIASRSMRPRDVTLEHARRFMDVSAEEWQPPGDADYTARRGIMLEFPYFFSLFESTRRHALYLIEAGRAQYPEAPPDLLVLFRLVDMTCHTSLADSELVPARRGQGSKKYARVVSEAYKAVDAAVGELMAAFGPADVIVVSDHGFDSTDRDGSLRVSHNRAPDGIFIGAGPAFRAGEVHDLSVYDMLPLLAHLKGFPVADDLAGAVPVSSLDGAFLAAHPIARIASYGGREGEAAAVRGDGRVDREMIERLRALGYVE